ncbi:hypothetical protein DY000_02033084 [Brassica cretica]|uniref:Uncharacterized protein n=1 Tax=Brassica cretica TaxID=69181 RepID=A0ABQ7DKA0_BRACR|nr:hypothetical protein DY000_02033084 [Brassica cretica]
MIDESWTHDALFSGYGWTWTNSREVTQLLGARNQQRRISQLHSELDGVHASSIDMLGFWHRLQGYSLGDQDSRAWSNFSTQLKELMELKSRFIEFSIVFIPLFENVSSDSLARIARSFHMDMYYIGCSLSVWFLIPSQA